MADGITFDSKKEMDYYLQLKTLQSGGAVAFFLRQVPFHLPARATYRADFMVFWTDGRRGGIVDVKGHRGRRRTSRRSGRWRSTIRSR